MISNSDQMFWDEVEANSKKEAISYSKFSYDSDPENGAIADFNKAKTMMETIKEDIATIAGDFSKLKELYDEFTGYNDSMDTSINRLNASAEEVSRYMSSLFSGALEDISELASKDTTFMEDLKSMNEMLKSTSVEEY